MSHKRKTEQPEPGETGKESGMLPYCITQWSEVAHFDMTYDVCHEIFLCDMLRNHTGVNRHAASRPVDGSEHKIQKNTDNVKVPEIIRESHDVISYNMCNCYITQSRLFPYQDIALGRLEELSAGRTGKESGYKYCSQFNNLAVAAKFLIQ